MKNWDNSILKLKTDICLTTSYQHIIHIKNTCAQFFERDSMESVMNTVVNVQLAHICKCSASSAVYGSLEKTEEKFHYLCFVPMLIGQLIEEFYKDSLNCTSNLRFPWNKKNAYYLIINDKNMAQCFVSSPISHSTWMSWIWSFKESKTLFTK